MAGDAAGATGLEVGFGEAGTVQTAIFHWLVVACFEARATLNGAATKFHKVGGVIRLRSDGLQDDIRYWTIDPLEDAQLTERAKILSLEMAREAESTCENAGGGKRRFILRAAMNGERRVIATHFFHIELDQDSAEPLDANMLALRMLRDAYAHNTESNRQMLLGYKEMREAVSQMGRTIAELAKVNEQVPSTIIELCAGIRGVSREQLKQEAEAFATAQKAQDFHDLADTVKPFIPMLIGGLLEKKSEG